MGPLSSIKLHGDSNMAPLRPERVRERPLYEIDYRYTKALPVSSGSSPSALAKVTFWA